jgi:hypothetical protein
MWRATPRPCESSWNTGQWPWNTFPDTWKHTLHTVFDDFNDRVARITARAQARAARDLPEQRPQGDVCEPSRRSGS